jgi:hypothetical protein
MQRSLLVFVLTGLCLAGMPLFQVAAQTTATVEIVGGSFSQFPDYTIHFRVQDAVGYDVLDLSEDDITILEDDMPISTDKTLTVKVADSTTPSLTLTLSNDREYPLYTTGATIGIVFDATTLLNADSDVDYVQAGREMIEQFLSHTGQQAPLNPEALSLFLPMDQPGQQMQPEQFVGFTQDRNALINYLNHEMQLRSGATNLYAAVQQAVQETAWVTRRRGSQAVVLVVSDGGDKISSDAVNETIRIAKEEGVSIVTFGMKPENASTPRSFQLPQLALLSGGMYQANPDAATIEQVYAETVHATPAALYTLQYQTTMPDDGETHAFELQVTLPGGQTITSETLAVVPGRNLQAQEILPANRILQRYFLLATPIAVLIPAVFILLIKIWRGSLQAVATRRATNIS